MFRRFTPTVLAAILALLVTPTLTAADAPLNSSARSRLASTTAQTGSTRALNSAVITANDPALANPLPTDSPIAAGQPPEVESGVASIRISAATRYGTSAALTRRICGAYTTGYLASARAGATALTVYMAGGTGFADGLAVSGNLGLSGPNLTYPNRSDASLAGTLAGPGPLLLTDPNRLQAETTFALDQIAADCGIERIIIIGGTAAVSEAVENALRTRYGTVERFGGRDRYATAIGLAAGLALARDEEAVSSVLGPLDTAIITTGTNFADAVAAGVIATRNRIPILLNDGPRLRIDVGNFLADNSINKVIIVGGTAAVPAGVAADLIALGADVTRLAGRTRFDTAARVAQFGFPAPSEIVLTNGYAFADALSATAFAAIHDAPVLLTEPDRLPLAVNQYLVSVANPQGRLWTIGGTSAVSPGVVNSAVSAYGG